MKSSSAAPIVTFPPIDTITTVDGSIPISLEERAIDVWGCSLSGSDVALEQCRAWLSEEERTRAARFIRHEDQLMYVLAHGGLRALLSRYAGLDPAAITFQAGPTGKPSLGDGEKRSHPLQFNLSHSHGRMLVAVGKFGEVGVDLEQVRDKVEVAKLAERFYARSERNSVAGLSGRDQARQFYRIWVAKEAVLKGQGVGLLSLQQCEILASDDASRAEVHLLEGTTMQHGWTAHWLNCGAGWAGAVSAPGSNWTIRVMTS